MAGQPQRAACAFDLPVNWGAVRFKNPDTWTWEWEELTHVEVDQRISSRKKQKKRIETDCSTYRVFSIPGGARFLPSTVQMFAFTKRYTIQLHP